MNLYRIITNGSALACAALALTLGWVLARQYRDPPPFQFTQAQYLPTRQVVCPGDVLEWRPSLRVTRVPTMLAVSRTVWDVTGRRTIQPASTLDFFVWTEKDEGETINRPTRFLLPPRLPAGLYEVRVGATAFNSDASAYRVPFVVPTACFRGGNRDH